MAYGMKVYDSTGFDITGNLTPVFYLEVVTGTTGNRSYGAAPAGKSLQYITTTITDVGTETTAGATVTVNGGDASWTDLPSTAQIIFYWG